MALPYVAIGANDSPTQPSFDRFEFSYGYGFNSDEQRIIIVTAQVQPAPNEPRPAENRIYVQPRWVDGGHGVRVLKPGYWTLPKQATVY